MVKITTCATSMPVCEEGQNCHRLHFPQIRSRWRLWRPEGRPLCRLLSKRPIITMVIFGPHQICIDFVFISIGTFLPEIPDGWFCVEWISQMGEFLLRTGFLCCISDEVSCYKYSFGQILGPDLCRLGEDRGGGLLARSVKFATKRNNPWKFWKLETS